MEKPQGEIFLIPARLEECDNLESLRHLHWVNLFEESGYENLMHSLNLCAEQVGAFFHGESVSKPVVRLAEKRYMVAHAGTLNNLGIVYNEMGNYSEKVFEKLG